MGWISDIGQLLLGWVRHRDAGADQRARRMRLQAMLEDERFQWRSLAQLVAASGTDPDTVRKDLVALGARPQENNPDMWGLIDRVGTGGDPVAR
ncbi:hypothetical protein AWH62_02155 [Maricaulis sp. W15]|uniref:hypothetical protein n=1 Tax=Maricaulis sp. W15 TaxID=1772333 RepID=UPI000948EDEC|nr:hypothetical protein [Maricaulis sp. W15]OLF81495.1 hypothetical protein AWH62_02155 [Maricaulis sp. W15]